MWGSPFQGRGATGCRATSPGTSKPRHAAAQALQPLTATEARQFLDAARTNRLHAPYKLTLRTGLRQGELVGLRWEDLDLSAGTARIRHSLQRTHTGGLTHPPTKTRASERRIALPTECIHSLKEHKQQQDTERGTTRSARQDSGLVVTTPAGRPLHPANITRRFRSLLDRAGLRHIRFHDLWHSTTTLLLERGIDPAMIKELLGHAHVRLRLQRHAIDTLGKALSPADNDPNDPPSTAVVR